MAEAFWWTPGVDVIEGVSVTLTERKKMWEASSVLSFRREEMVGKKQHKCAELAETIPGQRKLKWPRGTGKVSGPMLGHLGRPAASNADLVFSHLYLSLRCLVAGTCRGNLLKELKLPDVCSAGGCAVPPS